MMWSLLPGSIITGLCCRAEKYCCFMKLLASYWPALRFAISWPALIGRIHTSPAHLSSVVWGKKINRRAIKKDCSAGLSSRGLSYVWSLPLLRCAGLRPVWGFVFTRRRWRNAARLSLCLPVQCPHRHMLRLSWYSDTRSCTHKNSNLLSRDKGHESSGNEENT